MPSCGTACLLLIAFTSGVIAQIANYSNPSGKTIWDEAPLFQNDSIPPYPSLTNSNGDPLSIESLRGTHLFGWKGCTNEEANMIAVAYDDFYKLAQEPALYSSIDWSDPVCILSPMNSPVL